jgi:hypothetical protein
MAPSSHSHLSPLRRRLAHVFLEGSGERAEMSEAEVGGYLADMLSGQQQALRALDLPLSRKIGESGSGRLQAPAEDVDADPQSPTDLKP